MTDLAQGFPWRRSVIVWLGIIAAETLNGIFREAVITPVAGDMVGRRISFVIALIVIACVAAVFDRWLNYTSVPQAVMIGLIWMALTVLFEVALTFAFSPEPLGRLAADYDPRNGGLMAVGMIYLLFAPMIGRYLRRTVPG